MLKELWLTWILVSGLGESVTVNAQDTRNLTVVIDGYTVNTTLTSPATQLGRTALLVCRVSGIPHGQQTSYQWTCPENQPCQQAGYAAGRKVSNNIIAINTTSTSDGGTYTCTVTAGGMEGRQDFMINVNGGAVVHSYGRLLVNEAVITNGRQLQPPNDDTGDGRIECTISGGMSTFSFSPQYRVDSANSQKTTAVIPREEFTNFNNIEGKCGNTYLYLFLKKTDAFAQPKNLTFTTASTQSIEATLQFPNDHGIERAIIGYHRLDLGHEMVGQFHNNGIKEKLKFSGLVPGARYRITAWGLGGGTNKKRGSAPAVLEVTTKPSVPSPPRALTITRVFEDGIELNWLPPRETNGDIQHYIIRYTLKNGAAQEITTTDNTNYYNLTGLEGGQTYYNFTVKAVNLAHTSAQSNTTGNYTHIPGSLNTPTTKSDTSTATTPATTLITGTLVLYIGSGAGCLLLVLVAVLAVIICCVVAVHRRGKRSRSTDHTPTLHYYSTPGHEQEEEPQVQIGADNYDISREKPASFTPGTLYDEVEVKTVKSKPVVIPSEYQLPLVETDKEDDKEANNSVTTPESFYVQRDTTAKSNKKGEKGTTADVEDPDVLYAEVDKPKKKKKGKEKKEKQPQVGDLYAVVDKTSKKKGKDKKAKEKEQPGDEDLYAEVDKTQKKGKKTKEDNESNSFRQAVELDSPPPVPDRSLIYEPSADRESADQEQQQQPQQQELEQQLQLEQQQQPEKKVLQGQ